MGRGEKGGGAGGSWTAAVPEMSTVVEGSVRVACQLSKRLADDRRRGGELGRELPRRRHAVLGGRRAPR